MELRGLQGDPSSSSWQRGSQIQTADGVFIKEFKAGAQSRIKIGSIELLLLPGSDGAAAPGRFTSEPDQKTEQICVCQWSQTQFENSAAA